MSSKVNHNERIPVSATPINFLFMESGQKLKLAIDQSPYTQADFARAMDTDPQTIRNWINRGIPAKQAFKAGRVLGRDAEWLALDDAEMEERLSPEAAKREADASAMFDLLTDDQRAAFEAFLLAMIRRK